MNGLGFIIQNADFSGSPLGAVTFKKSPTELVEDYLALVGADGTKKVKLISLYRSLSALGVIDAIDIFPMLGSSLSNKLIGLKPSGSEFIFNALQAGDNASSITEGIAFADSDPNVNGLTPITKTFDDYHGLYMFSRIEGKRAGTGVLNWARVSTSSDWLVVTRSLGGGARIGYRLTRNGAITEIFEGNIGDSPKSVSSYIGSGTINTYLDGELWTTETVNSSEYPTIINNILAKQNDDNSHYFNAEVQMLALGFIDAAKVAAVDAAFRAYWE